MSLILAIIGMIAAGVFVANVVMMTFVWLKNKINKMLEKPNAKRVAVVDWQKFFEDELKNPDKGTRIDTDTLNKINNQGYSHGMVAVDSEDKIIGEVELIKNQNDTLDAEVEKLLGKDGFLVVEVS